MWLPAPIYERVPQFWLLIGLLFFAFGLYLGFEFELIFAYLALGALCIARSVWIFQARRMHRSKDAESNQDPAASEPVEHHTQEHSGGTPSF